MNGSGALLATYLGRNEATATAEEGVFGRDIAVEGFLAALLRFGAAGRYEFFHSPDRAGSQTKPEDMRQRVQQMAGPRTDVELVFSDVAGLRRAPERCDFRAWHERDGDLHLIADVRANYSKRLYPLTATSHVLSYPGLAHGWFLRMMLQKLYACDALVCTSQAARAATQKQFELVSERLGRSHGLDLRYEGRLEVIPLGIDSAVFRPAADKAVLRRQLGLPEGAFVLLWLGRLSFVDKADLLPLIQIFTRLSEANPSRELLLLIAGSGRPAFVEMLRHCAEVLGVAGSVRVIAPLAPSQRHLYHAAADVFVSPVDNIQETFGIAPIEAMACGVPQVVSDWSGYRDTVVDGETGFLIPTYLGGPNEDACLASGLLDECDLTEHFWVAQSTAVDPYAFQSALQHLLDNETSRHDMAEASRRRAVAMYDWRQVISSYERLWAELSSIAASTPYRPSPQLDYAVPAFVEVFGQYATSVLPAETCLVVSDAGRWVARGERPLPLFTEALGAISRDVLVAALTLFESRDPKGLPFGEATERLRSAKAETTDRAARHVMWLLKYGLLTLLAPSARWGSAP